VGEATGDFMPVQVPTATSPGVLAAIINRPSWQNSIRMRGARRSFRRSDYRAQTLFPASFPVRLRDRCEGDLI
jgi:hypothetical protein